MGALLTAAKPRIACLACLLPCLSLSGALFRALNYRRHTHSILFSRVSLSTGYRAQGTGQKARCSILTRVLGAGYRAQGTGYRVGYAVLTCVLELRAQGTGH